MRNAHNYRGPDPEEFEADPIDVYAAMPPPRTSPLILSTSVPITRVGSGAAGAAKNYGSEPDLTNPTEHPMLIDEITVQACMFDGTPAYVPPNNVLSNEFFVESPIRVLQAKLRIGSLALTRDLVPLWGLSERLDVRGDAAAVVYRPTWPILVPPGRTLSIELLYPAYPAGTTPTNQIVTAQVGYTCRALLDSTWPDGFKPDTFVPYPYITSYQPGPIVVSSVLQQFRSADNDLMNQASQDLIVTKLVGRALTASRADQATNTLFDHFSTIDQGHGSAGAVERGVFVRMETSEGLQIARDGAPFGHLFSSVDCAWWMNARLGVGKFYRAHLDVADTDTNDVLQVQPTITMHGWRMVHVSELM